jgi:hypothetical protein
MAGSSNITGDESIIYADNASFDGTERGGKLTTNGQLWIGSTASPHVKKGSITSPSGTLSIGYSSPNITLDLLGGTPAIEKVTVDANTAPGTNPVLPTGGLISITGAISAAHSIPIRTISTAANGFLIQNQVSTNSGGSSINNAGMASFQSTDFSVDGNGFVSLSATAIGKTITGDSGGALSPTASNWNILGRSGSKTSGSGSTLTIKSPPYADQGGSTTVTLNSGSFATAAITLTLPASAGLADGDLFEFVCTSASALIIQCVGTQKIRIGSLLSSSAGTATSTSIGDAVVLRFRTSDGFFYATSVVGTWLIA